MNDDLISREDLKKYKFKTQVYNGVEPEDVEVVPVAAIDNAPSVVAENATSDRPQGEWIYAYTNGFGNRVGFCSVCEDTCSPNNFCPNCGAKMQIGDRE